MHYYIITGASRGLGKALAEEALKQPDTSVLGVSRHATITHERYQHQPLDLSDMLAVQNNLYKLFPARPDATSLTLINNAGVLGEIGYVGELPNEHFEFVFDVNVVAPAMLMNTFLSAYGSQTSIPRTILNISSGAAQRPIDGWGAYGASKAALDALTRTAQKEQDLRSSGIRLRSLSPGVVDTAMQEHIRTADEQDFSEATRFSGLYSEGQLAQPEVTAGKILAWLHRPTTNGEEIVLRIDSI
ncbi:SDR family NAD(P)-dependent oxidoreductase [Hymenobacter norwichensis]|uniref:SDR family NAD(P)-dependent oxidoreductase n=1 Tax=Hymenobacter norwichensis TaxID=223903 RepID=UPI0003B6968C|nr:SDR family NAD(P)-dependent oxidoreductase [Hymenobacter norwichensis]